MKLKGKKLLKRLQVCHALGKSFREFLNRTAVHSYRYMVEPNRHSVERGMWIILHMIMTVASIYIVFFAWARFTENPTITTLESQHHSIYQLDFPAVAICNNNKISKTYATDYMNSMWVYNATFPLISNLKNLKHVGWNRSIYSQPTDLQAGWRN